MKSSLVGALVIAGTLAASDQALAASWSQFRANSRLTGVAGDTPASTPILRWTYEAGGSIESSVAIVDGVSIGESSPAVGQDAVVVGDLTGTVHAVDRRDGRRLWTFKTGGEVRSSPTLVEDLVLIGSYDTHLYALERNTGKLRWKLQTEGPVHATPAVQNGVIYIAGCDQHFRAVRLTDGK